MKYTNFFAFVSQIKSAASSGFLSRVYWIAASNDYERSQACDALLRYLLTPDRFLQKFSGTDFRTKDLVDALDSPSLLGGEPVVLLDEADKIPKGDFQALERIIARNFGYLILGAKGKSALCNAVEKEGVVLDLLGEKPWEKEKRIQQLLEARVKNAGKSIAIDALQLLLERQDLELGILEREIDKLLVFTGDRSRIEGKDILAIGCSNRTTSVWQTAEEMVWEKTGTLESASFHALVPAIRLQLQLGLKIGSLLAKGAAREEWSEALPKVFPKTLEKRTAQAEKLGVRYFARGLIALFEIELRSRCGSQQYGALLDWFRCQLR